MHFTRLQVVLIGVAIGLGTLAAGRALAILVNDLEMAVTAAPPAD
jgi:hypothetical protein